jgi:hypothetical protein
MSPIAAYTVTAVITPKPEICSRRPISSSSAAIPVISFSMRAFLLLRKLQCFQIALQVHLFELSQRQSQPPAIVRFGKRVAQRRLQVMSLDDRVQSVLRLRCQTRHLLSLCHQSAQFAHFLRRHPDPDQQAFRQ